MRFGITILSFFFFLFIFTPHKIVATSGCCSWHDGVCGCSGGRQLCCDGSLSPSCTCYSPPAVQKQRVFPVFPTSTTATWNWTPNDNKTFYVTVNLDDSSPSKYSAVLSKCKGCDPGPLVDFYSNKFTFQNIKPGTWYLNVKKEIDEYWSNTVYWTVNIPEWYSPPTPTIRLLPTSVSNSNSSNNSEMGILSYLGLGTLGYGGYYFVKQIIDANKS